MTGRRVKYAVVLFWLVVIAAAGPLAGKLTGAERNDARNYLPASAESTRALDIQVRFGSPDVLPAVVVYERRGGLTAADHRKLAADLDRYRRMSDVDGPVPGPDVSPDGESAPGPHPAQLRGGGVGEGARRGRRDPGRRGRGR